SECSLLFKAADARTGMQHQFRDLEVGIRFHSTGIAEGVFHIKFRIAEAGGRLRQKAYAKKLRGCGGKRNRVLGTTVGGNVGKLSEALAIVAGLNVGDRWGCSEHVCH